MTQMLIEAYIHTDTQTKAIETIKLLLEEGKISSAVQRELQVQLFVLTNRFELIDRDDDSVDLRLNDFSSEKGLLREAALLRAVQRLYRHKIKEAKKRFYQTSQSNHADSVHEQATIGLAFAKAAEDNSIHHFLEHIPNLPEHTTMPWYLWYLEFLLTSGQ